MKKCFLFFLLLIGILQVSAQEIKVVSIKLMQSDLTARTDPRMSADGQACALIRIVVPMVKNIQFSNTLMIGDQEYIPGEYKVWVYPGTKKLKFRHENYPSGEIVFADYLKDEDGNPIPIEGKSVYRIELDVPTIATTFEELIDIAREYSRNYPEHTESSYYLAGVTAYDQAIGHNDCPQTEQPFARRHFFVNAVTPLRVRLKQRRALRATRPISTSAGNTSLSQNWWKSIPRCLALNLLRRKYIKDLSNTQGLLRR